MDSGNNSGGSMQSLSSSGGDEESYNSRAESSSLSAFLNNPPLGPFLSTNLQNPLAPQHPHHHHHYTHMLDPLPNYLDPNNPIQQRSPPSHNPPPPNANNNSLLNFDMVWSKPARSEPNPTDLAQNHLAGLSGAAAAFPESASSRGGLLSVSATTHNNDIFQGHSSKGNVVRNPKKRPRASRRAPTTVLTTDTTNFRAMVQEFTGIPSPPFTSSSPFISRARFDLFAPGATSAIRSTASAPPPYLLRPFAQKFHPSLPNALSTKSSTISTPINYPLNINMHNNPNSNILSFQNILQTPPKYSTENPSDLDLVPKTQPLEFPPGGLNNQNMVSSSSSVGALLSDPLTEWAHATGTVNYCSVSSSPEFLGAKGTECTAAVAPARSEGMVESWINCSSD